MHKHYKIILMLGLATFLSCKNNQTSTEMTNLTEYKKTKFITTLESQVSDSKNSVYCVTLLYAWDKIRKVINAPLKIESKLQDLTILNNSKSYLNALKPDEYSATGEIEGDLVRAKAVFKKSLPYETALKSFTNHLIFNNVKVASFGIEGTEYIFSNIITILYYENDDNFVIKLQPKDKLHEIILYKSEGKFKTMLEIIAKINYYIEIGKIEVKNDNLNWKYYLDTQDIVVIPKLKFDIQSNYSELEGNRFMSNKKTYQIETVWQRTKFTLDEKGAEIQSEVDIAAAFDDLAKPKRLVFDKPFFLMMKRVNNKNPYLGLWITNSEFMVRE